MVVDLRGMFTTELKIRGTMRQEIASIASAVEKRLGDISKLIQEKDYQELTNATAELIEYNAYILSIDTHIKLSDKSDERQVILAMDNILKMIRYSRDDIKAISQLAMNEANNAT